MKRLVAAVLAVTAVIAATVAVGIASAASLSNPQEGVGCTTGTWHFVHVKTIATEGHLTATIGGVTYEADNGPPFSSKNLHYYINVTGDPSPLGDISDNVGDGKLVLSDCPKGSPPPPPPPPPPVIG